MFAAFEVIADVMYFHAPSRSEQHLKLNVTTVWSIMLMLPVASIDSEQTAAHNVLWMRKCVRLAFS